MEAELPDNPDLAWDLDDFNDSQRAKEFVTQFETTLCVYSPTVEQVYTTYNMFFPQEWERKLVVLPDATAHHNTFFNIEAKSVTPTGLYIIPGELLNRHGLYLANIDENRNLGKRQVPFEAGMRTIMQSRAKFDPFLPILAKGDLREFEKSWPVVHLHRVKPKVLEQLSQLDRNSLANVITEKLESLFLEQNKTKVA